MIQPVTDLYVRLTVSRVPNYAAIGLKVGQPLVNQLRGIVIVGVKKAREHSRISAKPPGIVSNCPEKDETQTGFTAHIAHALAVRELRLDRTDTGHYATSASSRNCKMCSPVTHDLLDTWRSQVSKGIDSVI